MEMAVRCLSREHQRGAGICLGRARSDTRAARSLAPHAPCAAVHCACCRCVPGVQPEVRHVQRLGGRPGPDVSGHGGRDDQYHLQRVVQLHKLWRRHRCVLLACMRRFDSVLWVVDAVCALWQVAIAAVAQCRLAARSSCSRAGTNWEPSCRAFLPPFCDHARARACVCVCVCACVR
jgi:hypothetical protein